MVRRDVSSSSLGCRWATIRCRGSVIVNGLYKMVFAKVDLLKAYVLFVSKGMITNERMDHVLKCGGKGG